MAARKKTAKKRAAPRVAPHPCKRCDGTGQFKTSTLSFVGKCFACDGTGTTTKQQREGVSKWRGGRSGGTVASLCRARRTVEYLSGGSAATTLYCYNKEGHDSPHKFMPKVSERNANDCGKPVAFPQATFPCWLGKNHGGACQVAANMGNSTDSPVTATGRQIQQTQDTLIGNHTARQLQNQLDAADAARATEATDKEQSAQPEAGWDISQRNDLDALVDLFKG